MPRGFRFETYEPRGSNIGALMMAPAQARARALREAGQAQARAAEIGGQATAGAINNIGNIISGGFQQYAQEKANAPVREMQGLQLEAEKARAAQAKAEAEAEGRLRALFAGEQPPTPEAIIETVGPERGLSIVKGLTALQTENQNRYKSGQELIRDVLAGMEAIPEALRAEVYPGIRQNLVQRQIITEQDAPSDYDPAWFQQARNFGKQAKDPKTRQVEERQPDGSVKIRIVEDTPGQEFTSAPEVKPVTFSAPTPAMVGGRRAFIRAGSDGKLYDTSNQPIPDGAATPIAPQGPSGAAEPLIAVIGPNGRPVLVRRSQAEGMAPASTREQGRAVTSGDAGRIAELDTSLDDLKVLGDTLTSTEGATGTLSRVGAMLPNVVTELTGVGEEAKQRQAVIDRVKQVIGKALEGGVLRKEDEAKYTKILPTIGDTAAVAAQKLRGLEQAIRLRRDRQIDALEDSGYDTSKFRERGASGPVKVGGFTVEVEKPKGGG